MCYFSLSSIAVLIPCKSDVTLRQREREKVIIYELWILIDREENKTDKKQKGLYRQKLK